jgi:hypothetical protein
MCNLAPKTNSRLFALVGLLALLCNLAGLRNVSADILPNTSVGVHPAQNRQSAGYIPQTDPSQQCRTALAIAGRQYGIPDHVLAAIAQVESGRLMPDGRVVPWPWSINVAGNDHIFESRDEAVASVRRFQAAGSKSIDIGCMQINLLHHPTAFTTLEQGFDPAANTAYAARFLRELFSQTGSWPRAIANYHSATPQLGEAYRRRVMQVMAQQTHAGPQWAETAQASRSASDPAMTTFAPLPSGAVMLGNHAELSKLLPQSREMTGRGLEAYRARTIRVAGRPS